MRLSCRHSAVRYGLELSTVGDCVLLRGVDDGVGGADPAGSGLAERVRAAGGYRGR